MRTVMCGFFGLTGGLSVDFCVLLPFRGSVVGWRGRDFPRGRSGVPPRSSSPLCSVESALGDSFAGFFVSLELVSSTLVDL